ncbi:MAG: energy transducer TonB [Gemmatimonadetes bacterium]|nr:energy transducer TonB [Gemmatimonadota bacterium]
MTLRTTATIFAAASALLLVRPLSLAAQTTAPAAQDTATAPAASPADIAVGDHEPRLLNPRQLEARERSFYPTLLHDAGVVGTAQMRFTVKADGRIADIQSLNSSHDTFAEAAVHVVHGLRYAPAVSGGHPVDAVVTLMVEFSLPGHPAS